MVEVGHAFDLHIAMLELALFILFEQNGAAEADEDLA
jgi:hypothetical protein